MLEAMVGQGEVGGYTQRVQTAWPRLDLATEGPWLALGDWESPLLGIYGHIFLLRQVGIS